MRKVSTTIYITPQQADRLKLLHERTKVPISVYIREGIDMILECKAEPMSSVPHWNRVQNRFRYAADPNSPERDNGRRSLSSTAMLSARGDASWQHTCQHCEADAEQCWCGGDADVDDMDIQPQALGLCGSIGPQLMEAEIAVEAPCWSWVPRRGGVVERVCTLQQGHNGICRSGGHSWGRQPRKISI